MLFLELDGSLRQLVEPFGPAPPTKKLAVCKGDPDLAATNHYHIGAAIGIHSLIPY